jgi:hypothetical protein
LSLSFAVVVSVEIKREGEEKEIVDLGLGF